MLATIMDPGRRHGHGSPVSTRRTEAASVKDHLAYMSQKFGLYQDLTVGENIDFYADLYGMSRKGDRNAWASCSTSAICGPSSAAGPANLSGGMKQKLQLVCALIHTPEGAAARRADQRRRSGEPPRFLAHPAPAAGGTGGDPRLHRLPRRGRALRPGRPHRPRQDACHRHPRRNETADEGPDLCDQEPRRPPDGRTAAPRAPRRKRQPLRRHGPSRLRRGRRQRRRRSKRSCKAHRLQFDQVREIVPSLEDVFVSLLGAGGQRRGGPGQDRQPARRGHGRQTRPPRPSKSPI